MVRLRSLRIITVVMLVLLALQFELGMAVNLSPGLEDVPPVPATAAAIWGALAKVGSGALEHAALGTLLTIMAVVALVLSVSSGSWGVAVLGALSFVGIALATVNGVLFTLSGFRDDGYSHGMATAFLVAFSFCFIQVGILSAKLRR